MVTREELIKESTRYLNEGKPCLTCEDIIVYRAKQGDMFTIEEKDRSIFKIVLGGFLCALGLVTIPLPTGSFFMIGAGCSFMIDGGFDLWGCYRKVKGKIVYSLWRLRGRCNKIKKELLGEIISKPTLLNF